MKLLDLFCGAGGAAEGYHRAGFTEITGVDIKPQPHYPFGFIQADASCPTDDIDYSQYDLIHASPPCQAYSAGRYWARGQDQVAIHPDLIDPVRGLLRRIGKPYVIENVVGAPLINPVTLCGSMFGLRVSKGYLRRHRLFESSFTLPSVPECAHKGRAVSVCGHGAGGMWGYRKADVEEARALLEIDWMSRDELAQAIPPAYTEWIGRQFLGVEKEKISMTDKAMKQGCRACFEQATHSYDCMFAGSGPSPVLDSERAESEFAETDSESSDSE